MIRQLSFFAIICSFASCATEKTPEEFGAVGDGKADDTEAIVKALEDDRPLHFEPQKVYRITRAIEVPSNTKILGGEWSVIRIGSKPGEIDASTSAAMDGLHDAAFIVKNAANVQISGFRVEKEYVADQHVRGIVIRNSENVLLQALDFQGFSRAKGIVKIDSGRNVVVADSRFHDCLLDGTTFGQLTGIDIDDHRVNDTPSNGIELKRNTFENLGASPTFRALHKEQTDAVNVSSEQTRAVIIEDNFIDGTGEGIDVFGSDIIIRRNVIRMTRIAGIKLVHGASNNLVENNVITNTGLAGILVSGSETVARDTDGNIVQNNSIRGLNHFAEFPAGIAAGIRIRFEGYPFRPTRNKVMNNWVFGVTPANPAIHEEPALSALNNIRGTANIISGNRLGLFDDFPRLESSWKFHRGAAGVNDGRLVESSGGFLATRTGRDSADGEFGMQISFAGFPSHISGESTAGIVARYKDDRYYVARLVTRSSGLTTVELLVRTPSATRSLGEVPVSKTFGYLSFTLTRDRLRVAFNQQVLIDVRDSEISNAGSAGIEAGILGLSSIDNFSLP